MEGVHAERDRNEKALEHFPVRIDGECRWKVFTQGVIETKMISSARFWLILATCRWKVFTQGVIETNPFEFGQLCNTVSPSVEGVHAGRDRNDIDPDFVAREKSRRWKVFTQGVIETRE